MCLSVQMASQKCKSLSLGTPEWKYINLQHRYVRFGNKKLSTMKKCFEVPLLSSRYFCFFQGVKVRRGYVNLRVRMRMRMTQLLLLNGTPCLQTTWSWPTPSTQCDWSTRSLGRSSQSSSCPVLLPMSTHSPGYQGHPACLWREVSFNSSYCSYAYHTLLQLYLSLTTSALINVASTVVITLFICPYKFVHNHFSCDKITQIVFKFRTKILHNKRILRLFHFECLFVCQHLWNNFYLTLSKEYNSIWILYVVHVYVCIEYVHISCVGFLNFF